MANLTATSYVVQEPGATGITENFSHQYVTIEGKKKHAFAQIRLLTSGAVPSAGIPLPTFGRVGMVRNVDYYILITPLHLTTGVPAWTTVCGVSLQVASGGKHLEAFQGTTSGGLDRLVSGDGGVLASGMTLLVKAVGW